MFLSKRVSLHLLAELPSWILLWLQFTWYQMLVLLSPWELRSGRILLTPNAACSHFHSLPHKKSFFFLRLMPPIYSSFSFLPRSVNLSLIFHSLKNFATCFYPSTHEDLPSCGTNSTSTCITSTNTVATPFLDLLIPFSIRGPAFLSSGTFLL